MRLVGHVAVQRHRFAAEPAGDGAHRDRVQATLVDQAQCAPHDRVAGQPLHAYSVSASVRAYTVSRRLWNEAVLVHARTAWSSNARGATKTATLGGQYS